MAIDEVPLAYLPGGIARLHVQVVGDLVLKDPSAGNTAQRLATSRPDSVQTNKLTPINTVAVGSNDPIQNAEESNIHSQQVTNTIHSSPEPSRQQQLQRMTKPSDSAVTAGLAGIAASASKAGITGNVGIAGKAGATGTAASANITGTAAHSAASVQLSQATQSKGTTVTAEHAQHGQQLKQTKANSDPAVPFLETSQTSNVPQHDGWTVQKKHVEALAIGQKPAVICYPR